MSRPETTCCTEDEPMKTPIRWLPGFASLIPFLSLAVLCSTGAAAQNIGCFISSPEVAVSRARCAGEPIPYQCTGNPATDARVVGNSVAFLCQQFLTTIND